MRNLFFILFPMVLFAEFPSNCTECDWEAFLHDRCEVAKSEEEFRVFDESAPEHVKEFYRINHQNQTLELVLAKKAEYLPLMKQYLPEPALFIIRSKAEG